MSMIYSKTNLTILFTKSYLKYFHLSVTMHTNAPGVDAPRGIPTAWAKGRSPFVVFLCTVTWDF